MNCCKSFTFAATTSLSAILFLFQCGSSAKQLQESNVCFFSPGQVWTILASRPQPLLSWKLTDHHEIWATGAQLDVEEVQCEKCNVNISKILVWIGSIVLTQLWVTTQKKKKIPCSMSDNFTSQYFILVHDIGLQCLNLPMWNLSTDNHVWRAHGESFPLHHLGWPWSPTRHQCPDPVHRPGEVPHRQRRGWISNRGSLQVQNTCLCLSGQEVCWTLGSDIHWNTSSFSVSCCSCRCRCRRRCCCKMSLSCLRVIVVEDFYVKLTAIWKASALSHVELSIYVASHLVPERGGQVLSLPWMCCFSSLSKKEQWASMLLCTGWDWIDHTWCEQR